MRELRGSACLMRTGVHWLGLPLMIAALYLLVGLAARSKWTTKLLSREVAF